MSSDHVPENSARELQHVSVQVEHVIDEEPVQVETVSDVVDDEAHSDDVLQSPPVLQLEEDVPIAHRRQKRGCGPKPRLIEECNMTYYALSCAE
ncbi:hypothetical protein FA727_23855 [Robertmurraya kyonggiensis]|uniref:Uncharacterized protein n=1 Tax=Robertmurraya kyonggiensis TaxID=1037680 RepID=A0A4U1CUY9_9BACI|nr:hypothetical protein FA727_23855 [Robertmurraya kyonggiensis]